MARPTSKRTRQVIGVANGYGVSLLAARRLLPAIEKCKDESTAGIFVNMVRRKVGLEPLVFLDPRVVSLNLAIPNVDPDPAWAPLTITETADEISITLPKRPIERMTREQAVGVLAMRRAGGIK
jgi:hypothetical protein